jgi:pimeloyl-ACP methyl ester carboxylesterase
MAQPRHKKLHNQIWYWVTMPGTWILNPFVSEIGRPSWDIMQRRNKTLFRMPSEFEKEECADRSERCQRGTGALAVFLQHLETFIKQHHGHAQDNGDYTVTLIGHSMGTIVVNQILSERPQMHFDNVVFMAAAVSTHEVLDHTIPYLANHQATQFYSLSLRPNAENTETSLIGVEPSGSLLVWIDSYYTSPLTQLDRTFGRWENVRSALHVFPPEILQRQMHFKIFGYDERNSPQEHGEFGRYPFWRPNFWWKGSWKHGTYFYDAPSGEPDTLP